MDHALKTGERPLRSFLGGLAGQRLPQWMLIRRCDIALPTPALPGAVRKRAG